MARSGRGARICTHTRCGIPARPICWRGGRTSAPFRKCWAIRVFPPPSGTHTCPSTSCSRYTTGRTPWHRRRGSRPPPAAMGQPANRSNLSDRVLKAISGALLGSTIGLLLATTIDCAYARGDHYGARWLADAGLLAPLALALGAGMTAVRLFFHGGDRPRPGQALAAMNRAEPKARARLTALGLSAPLAFVLWLIAVANLATRLLGSEVPASTAG